MKKHRGFNPYWQSKEKREERNKYPKFIFKNEGSDPDFSQIIKEIIQKFDFNDIPDELKPICKNIKELGYWKAIEPVKKNFKFGEDMGSYLVIDFLSELVFSKFPKDKFNRYFPFNDFRLLPLDREIIVQCRSAKRFRSSKGTCYYSTQEPTIDRDGVKYVVTFTRHSIERICDRIHPNWKTHSALGDVYAYLEENLYFEFCKLRDGSPAITFYDQCGGKGFWHYQYVDKVFGKKNLILGKGSPYFRVGYCPLAFEGNFAVAKTLLFPGYSKTPEYECILNLDLPDNERKSLFQEITKQDAKSLLETGDFSSIKWLHENTIPQVVQMNKKIYDHEKSIILAISDLRK
ncbi:hypothetical protein H6F44_04840 [Pseudanabaena sp. FACHB-1277]|uniref:Uncharacterized protein n=1 Tax=Pseudanabaena cinerea FACHB-1277 TaxID=2949581 RepID=A0A926USX0_9CYAN|nr:hypothetical protein [Pseudanabaena cinerea]MBD2149455.1 hypothetical protein [Pseudanabaena cinerea FACHB-1277]